MDIIGLDPIKIGTNYKIDNITIGIKINGQKYKKKSHSAVH